MIFVDTSAWFASVIPSDQDHIAATDWLNQNTELLITADYVVDETLTLLKARGQPAHAMRLGEEFFRGRLVRIYFLVEDDIYLTWQTFKRFSDKGWSFTDCSSKVAIDKLQLTPAFTFDHHFRQFGSIIVVP
jgi:uncharacterized protein